MNTKYVLHYVCENGYTEEDYFEGTWFELQEFIQKLRACGCTDISAACIFDYEEDYYEH